MVLDERLGGGMQRILSTYRYVNQQLSPALLTEIARAGASGVEIFCSAFHFNYGNPQSVREIANSLDECGLKLQSLHAPTERDSTRGPGSGLAVSISEPERIRRQEAVDEVKRALDVAETIPFRYLVQHLGSSRQPADRRNLDAAFGSLEQLVVFAKHRGVTIALENTPSEIGISGVAYAIRSGNALERSAFLLRYRPRACRRWRSSGISCHARSNRDHAHPR